MIQASIKTIKFVHGVPHATASSVREPAITIPNRVKDILDCELSLLYPTPGNGFAEIIGRPSTERHKER